jgi:hypothetical protein
MYGKPIYKKEQLFGREKIVYRIKNNIKNNIKITLLHVQRRIGKTSLITCLPQYFTEEHNHIQFVRLSLEGWQNKLIPEILKDIALDIAENIDEVPEQESKLANSPENFFQLFLPTIINKYLSGKNLVLLLDEFDVLEEDTRIENRGKRLFYELEKVVKQQEKLFAILIFGRPLKDMTYLEEFLQKEGKETIEVGLLDEKSTHDLIVQPATGTLEYEADAINAIWQLSTGHPSLIQLLCLCIFDYCREQKIKKVTDNHVLSIIDDAMERGEAVLEGFLEPLDKDEKLFFCAVAKAQNEVGENQLKTNIKNPQSVGKRLVEEYGFLEEKADGTGYKIKVELVHCWLTKKYAFSDTELLQSETDQTFSKPKYSDTIENYSQAKSQIVDPIMSSNQFYPNDTVPPGQFIGRTSELYTIFDQINNRGHAAIYGSSGMGKSSLLEYIKSPNFWEEKGLELNFSKALIVYHNCDVSTTPNSFWQEVLKELRNKAEGDTDLQKEIDGVLEKEEIGIRDIRQILKHIGEKDKFLLLLLDDYHGILSTPESYSKEYEKSQEMQTFLSGLRNLAVHSKEGQYFSTVVAAFQKLNELGPELPRGGSPWYNHYLYVDLKPFSQEDIDNYFFNPNGHFFISIPDNISKKEVLEITGGYPILLQHAGYIFSESYPNIDINIFKEKFKNRTEQIYENIWREITKDEQNLLKLIIISNSNGEVSGKRFTLNDIDKDFEANKSKLTTLQQKGVIYNKQDQEPDKYNFSSSLMQDFVRQKFEKNLSDPEERKVLFQSSKFRTKITEKNVNIVKKVYRFLSTELKELLKGLFNKSE